LLPILAFIFFIPEVDARTPATRPRIISRAQWGADESLLTSSKNGTMGINASDVGETGGNSERAKECRRWQKNYPQDFKKGKIVTHDSKGRRLRWPQEYSPEVKLIVVHHTALKIAGDKRPPDERMRALYEYHADKLGWGDIGYNYVIDEKGNIYEGRKGGKGVISGHVYCANTLTNGIALMSNFEVEKPTQRQLRSLMKLIYYLAQEYNINPRNSVRFHGELMFPIVGHEDIGHTRCPGYYLHKVMPQIRAHVIAGKLDSMIYIKSRQDSTHARRTARLAKLEANQPILRAAGATEIIGRPGSNVYLQLQYIAGDSRVPRRARLAKINRSSNRIGIWQQLNNREIMVRKELISPVSMRPRETQLIQMRVLLPRQAKAYELTIGDITFVLRAEGRRVPLSDTIIESQSRKKIMEERLERRRKANKNTSIEHKAIASSDKTIRIRLGFEEEYAKLNTSSLMSINGQTIGGRVITLRRDGNKCTARMEKQGLVPVPIPKHQSNLPKRDSATDRNVAGAYFESEALRIDPGSGIITITNWNKRSNKFRGVIECRIVDEKLTLINALPLEQYLWGLAEEPDTEPYEKQRAFAIAARSYAAFYIHPNHRKFPGKPYDGDDSPARFQMYGGLYFEEKNPRWVKAVKNTENLIVSKNGKIVKTPYFSSDDGRTRSPEERGWKFFPFSEVFQSKPDPWCNGMTLRGHGVGMSGCGAEGQAEEGRKAEDILKYYYEGTELKALP